MPASHPTVSHLTPVLVVDTVEPCVGFWTERLGFTVENELPGPEGALVFASGRQGTVEVMYPARASVVADAPALSGTFYGSTELYVREPGGNTVGFAQFG